MQDISEICNLEPEDLDARRSHLRQTLVPKARARAELPDGVALLFDATTAMRQQLDAFVAFERQCCPSLRFSVSETAGTLRLEIHGIDPRASVFEGVGQGLEQTESLAQAGQPAQATPRRWRRIVSAAGVGALGALVVCCLVPVALVATLGTAAAAPFTSLDNPAAISATALLLAALVWGWQRRRDATRCC